MQPNITVLDGFAANPGDISWDEIAKLGHLTVYDRTPYDEIVNRCRDSEIVLTNKCNITRELIEQLPRLKYIGELATGYNNIDVAAAAERGIAVSNVPAYSTGCVAQLVMAFILEIALHVGEHSRACLNGQWQNAKDFTFWNYPLRELEGMTLGVIGAGKIGSRVAELAKAFGMTVKTYSPSRCEKEVLDDIIENCDILSLNCPLKSNNVKMINAQTLGRMKRGAWLINTARGALVDEDAVRDVLVSGQLGYYCADVVSVEPIKADNPLLSAPNVILTPHIGWATFEARERLMKIAAQNLKAYLSGERLNRVDA